MGTTATASRQQDRETPSERGATGPALVAASAWLVVAFAVQLAETLIA